MAYQRDHKSSSWNPPTQQKSSQFAPRPFTVPAQQNSSRPPTQEEIENKAFQQHKFEAFGLQLKEESGTITPEGKERLGVLQAKMDEFWAQRRESTKGQPNLLEILSKNAGGTPATEPAKLIQPKLTLNQPSDKFDQVRQQGVAVNGSSQVVQLNHTPEKIKGAMSDVEVPASSVDEAISSYLKTGKDVSSALDVLEILIEPDKMNAVAGKHSLEDAKHACTSLKELFPQLRKFAEKLEPLGDGAREPALFFLNQLETLNGHLTKGMPPQVFVTQLATLPNKAMKLLGEPTEMGMVPMEPQEQPAPPEVGKSMEEVAARYDVISRKTSASTRRKGAIHEVDLAMMPRLRGIADIKAVITDEGKVMVEPGQAERAFAIGYVGAITFEGNLSNQGGERYYATLFPKGWLAQFSQDVRTAGPGGRSAREPGAEEFASGQFSDQEVQITIEEGKAFLIRAEDSTAKEGQITMHMDRNQLLFGGKPMLQFVREATVGVVEFDAEGNVLYFRIF